VAKEQGEISLRLGVTGTGQIPNYRIENAEGIPILAVDGATHEEWPEHIGFGGSSTWSQATMSRQEVEDLLGELRGFSRALPLN
jgi:hypothetical protein